MPISLDFGHFKKLTQMWRFLSRDSPHGFIDHTLREPLPKFGKGQILFLTFVFGCFPLARPFQLWGTSMDSDHLLGDVC